MKKRLTFKCWNCGRTYELTKTLTDQQELVVECPFCGKKATAALKRGRKLTVLRGDEAREPEVEYEYILPKVILTREET